MLAGVAMAVVGAVCIVGILREAFKYMESMEDSQQQGGGVVVDDDDADEGAAMLTGLYDAYGGEVMERPWVCTGYLAAMAVLVGATMGQVTAVRCVVGWTALVCFAGFFLL